MPLLADSDGEMQSRVIAGTGFTFNAVRIGDLGATEYTLADIVVDLTGSTAPFANELRDTVVTSVATLKRSPRSDNLLLRVTVFSTMYPLGVMELHGYVPLDEIDVNAYPTFQPMGATPLYDATFSAIGAMYDYGADLRKNKFAVNGIAIIITDGCDNDSTMTPALIRDKIVQGTQLETLESLVSIVVGINAAQYRNVLEAFVRDAGLGSYIDAGDATPAKLAKLADFISHSVSSQSQALGSGGPSQAIAAII